MTRRSAFLISFDKPLDANSFSLSDIALTDPSNSPVTLNSVTLVSGTSSEYEIQSSAIWIAGDYAFTLGPDVLDQYGNSMGAEFTTQLSVADPAVVVADEYSIDEDQMLIVLAAEGLLANDFVDDAYAGSLSVTLLSDPAHGTLWSVVFPEPGQPAKGTQIVSESGSASIPEGAFIFDPGDDFNGTDSFSYELSYGSSGETSQAQVTITVNPVNDAPELDTITDKTISTPGDSITFEVTAGDVDAYDTLTFSLDPGSAPGASIAPDGSDPDTKAQVSWTSDANEHGTFSINVRVTDAAGLTDVQTVWVHVGSANLAPNTLTAEQGGTPFDTISIPEESTLTFTVTGSDPDTGDVLTYSLAPGAPQGASLVGSSFSWTPTEEQDGVHEITIVATDDGNPPLSITKTIAVTVDELWSVDSLKLKNDTGTADDRITTDTVLVGSVAGNGVVDAVSVALQIEYIDQNLTPPEQVFNERVDVGVDGTFTVQPMWDGWNAALTREYTVKAQAIEYDFNNNLWPSFDNNEPFALLEFEYNVDTDTSGALLHDFAPEVSQLELLDGTLEGGVTSDPTLYGCVLNDGSVDHLDVLFRRWDVSTSTWLDVGSTQTDSDGRFTFVPEGLALGDVNWQACAVEISPRQGFIAQEWIDLSPDDPEFVDTPNHIGFTLVSPESAPGPTIPCAMNSLALANDSGTIADNWTTCDPTIVGSLSFSTGYSENRDGILIQLDYTLDGTGLDGEPDGQIETDENGEFRYTPNLPLSYDSSGQLVVDEWSMSLAARVLYHDPDTGETHFSDWTALTPPTPLTSTTISLDENAPPEIAGLSLANDSGGSADDRITSDATVVGTITDDTSMDFVIIEFDHDGDGVIDGSTMTDESGSFTYVPLGLEAGQIDLRARAVEWDQTRQVDVISTEWETFSFGYDPDADSMPVITSFEVAYDSGTQDPPESLRTNDPTVTGTLDCDGDPSGVYVAIFLADGDEWVSMGSTLTDDDGRFVFTPFGVSAGVTTLKAEVQYWNSALQSVACENPAEVTFTLDSEENDSPSVTNMSFENSKTTNDSGRPFFEGDVGNDGIVAGVPVQFELYDVASSTWSYLGETETDESGHFSWLPDELDLGNICIRARAGEVTYLDPEPVFDQSLWQEYTVALGAADSTVPVPELELETFEDVGGTIHTKVPTLLGAISVDGDPSRLTIEFDYNQDGNVDGYTTTDSLGEFTFTPIGLATGTHQLKARLVAEGVDAYWACSDWSDTLAFTLETNAAPEIGTIALLNDTGASAFDGYTVDPRIIGTVTNDTSVEGLQVTIEVTRDVGESPDWIANGTTTTDASGSFEYTPVGLAAGGWQIRARVSEFNHSTSVNMQDESDPIILTLCSPAEGEVVAFNLVSDTGEYDSDGVTADPTLEGAISGFESPETVVIEVDHDNDGTIDGTASCGADGSFEYLPVGLPMSTQMNIRARARQTDYTTSENMYSEWSDVCQVTHEVFLDETLQEPQPIIKVEIASLSLAQGIVLTPSRENKFGTTEPWDVEPVQLEVDLDGDGIADDSIELSSWDSVTYTPPQWQTNGSTSISIRPVVLGLEEGIEHYIYGDWTTESYSIEITFDSCSIGFGTEATNYQSMTSGADLNEVNDNVVIDGKATWAFDTPVTVEFDYIIDPETGEELDGVADDSVVAELNGDFQYEPWDFDGASVIVSARLVALHPEIGELVYSDWLPSTSIDFVVTDGPSVSDLHLLSDNGVSVRDGITTDPTFAGRISTAEDEFYLSVEIDTNNDLIPDDVVTADASGNFVYTPSLTLNQETTVNVRGVRSDFRNVPVVGLWSSLTITQIPVATPVVAAFNLLEEVGTSLSGPLAVDPTLTGRLSHDGSVLYPTVEFDLNQDFLPDTEVTADPDGVFRYTPSGLSLGTSTIRARGVLDTDEGKVVGDWSTITFILVSESTASIEWYYLDDAAKGVITGQATLNGIGTTLLVDFDLDGNGTVDESVETDDDGRFSHIPGGLVDGTNTVHLRARFADPAYGEYAAGEWEAFTFDLDPEPLSVAVPTFFTLDLAYDTGTPGDAITSDPTIEVQLARTDGPVGALLLDFEYQFDGGAWQPGGTVPTDGQGYALWTLMDYTDPGDPLPLTPAPNQEVYQVRVSVREWDAVNGQYATYGPVVMTNTFTLKESQNDPPAITSITQESATPENLYPEPTIRVVVQNDGPLAGLVVEFDHDGDGIADGSGLTDQDGYVWYSPRGLQSSEEPISITAWSRESDYFTGDDLTSTPFSTTITYNPVNIAPEITGLALRNDTGTYQDDSLTMDPTIKGTVVNEDGNAAGVQVFVEIDDGSGNYVLNGTTVSEADGSFVYTPSGLEVNDIVTLRVYAQEYDPLTDSQLSGDTDSLTFTVGGTNTAPTITAGAISLVEDTDIVGDKESSNPTITGIVTNPDGTAEGLVVEILYSDEVIGRTTTDSDGRFTYTPTDLTTGSVILGVRPLEWDPINGVYLGQAATPTEFSFTLVANTNAQITAMGLLHPDTPITDPTVVGQVSNPDGRDTQLLVEFDVDGDDVVDGSTFTDSTGAFSYSPFGLAAGSVTIRARVREWDYGSGTYSQASWPGSQDPGYLSFELANDVLTPADADATTAEPDSILSAVDSAMMETIIAALSALGAEGSSRKIDIGIGSYRLFNTGESEFLDDDNLSGRTEMPFVVDTSVLPADAAVEFGTKIGDVYTYVPFSMDNPLDPNGDDVLGEYYYRYNIARDQLNSYVTVDVELKINLTTCTYVSSYDTQTADSMESHAVTLQLAGTSPSGPTSLTYTFACGGTFYYDDRGSGFTYETAAGTPGSLAEGVDYQALRTDIVTSGSMSDDESSEGTRTETAYVDHDYTYSEETILTDLNTWQDQRHEFDWNSGHEVDYDVAFDGSGTFDRSDTNGAETYSGTLDGSFETTITVTNGVSEVVDNPGNSELSYTISSPQYERITSYTSSSNTDETTDHDSEDSGGTDLGSRITKTTGENVLSVKDTLDYTYTVDYDPATGEPTGATAAISSGSIALDNTTGSNWSTSDSGTYDLNFGNSQSSGSYSYSISNQSRSWRWAMGQYTRSIVLDPATNTQVVSSAYSLTTMAEDSASSSVESHETYQYETEDAYGSSDGAGTSDYSSSSDYSMKYQGAATSTNGQFVHLGQAIQSFGSQTQEGSTVSGSEKKHYDGYSEDSTFESARHQTADFGLLQTYSFTTTNTFSRVQGIQMMESSAHSDSSSKQDGTFVQVGLGYVNKGEFHHQNSTEYDFSHSGDTATITGDGNDVALSGGSYIEITSMTSNTGDDEKGTTVNIVGDKTTIENYSRNVRSGSSQKNTEHVLVYEVRDEVMTKSGTFDKNTNEFNSSTSTTNGTVTGYSDDGTFTTNTNGTYAKREMKSYQLTLSDEGTFIENGVGRRSSGTLAKNETDDSYVFSDIFSSTHTDHNPPDEPGEPEDPDYSKTTSRRIEQSRVVKTGEETSNYTANGATLSTTEPGKVKRSESSRTVVNSQSTADSLETSSYSNVNTTKRSRSSSREVSDEVSREQYTGTFQMAALARTETGDFTLDKTTKGVLTGWSFVSQLDVNTIVSVWQRKTETAQTRDEYLKTYHCNGEKTDGHTVDTQTEKWTETENRREKTIDHVDERYGFAYPGLGSSGGGYEIVDTTIDSTKYKKESFDPDRGEQSSNQEDGDFTRKDWSNTHLVLNKYAYDKLPNYSAEVWNWADRTETENSSNKGDYSVEDGVKDVTSEEKRRVVSDGDATERRLTVVSGINWSVERTFASESPYKVKFTVGNYDNGEFQSGSSHEWVEDTVINTLWLREHSQDDSSGVLIVNDSLTQERVQKDIDNNEHKASNGTESWVTSFLVDERTESTTTVNGWGTFPKTGSTTLGSYTSFDRHWSLGTVFTNGYGGDFGFEKTTLDEIVFSERHKKFSDTNLTYYPDVSGNFYFLDSNSEDQYHYSASHSFFKDGEARGGKYSERSTSTGWSRIDEGNWSHRPDNGGGNSRTVTLAKHDHGTCDTGTYCTVLWSKFPGDPSPTLSTRTWGHLEEHGWSQVEEHAVLRTWDTDAWVSWDWWNSDITTNTRSTVDRSVDHGPARWIEEYVRFVGKEEVTREFGGGDNLAGQWGLTRHIGVTRDSTVVAKKKHSQEVVPVRTFVSREFWESTGFQGAFDYVYIELANGVPVKTPQQARPARPPVKPTSDSYFWAIVEGAATGLKAGAYTVVDAFTPDCIVDVKEAKAEAWKDAGLEGTWTQTISEGAAGASREALIMATTLGVGSAASAARCGTMSAKALNAAKFGFEAYDAYQTGEQFVSGVERVMDGDPMGFLDIGLSVFSGVTTLKSRRFPKGKCFVPGTLVVMADDTTSVVAAGAAIEEEIPDTETAFWFPREDALLGSTIALGVALVGVADVRDRRRRKNRSVRDEAFDALFGRDDDLDDFGRGPLDDEPAWRRLATAAVLEKQAAAPESCDRTETSGEFPSVETLERNGNEALEVLPALNERTNALSRTPERSVASASPSRFRRWFWAVGWLALAGCLGWFGLGADSTPREPSAPRLAAAQAPASLPTKAIEEVRLGDRVAGRNPIRAEAETVEPDRATWRRIALRMTKSGGGDLWIELLRPAWWIEEHDARVGATVHIELHEMGAVGDAEVIRVGPCPEIQPGEAGTVVTGIFRHEADEDAGVVKLKLEGRVEPIAVTGNHAFWSVDRREFLEVAGLHVDELVDTEYGERRVVSVTPLDDYTGFLYNLETLEHVYRVGSVGTLVHNTCVPSDGKYTRFVDDATVTDIRTGRTWTGTVDVKPTVDRIRSGGSFPHRRDGGIFNNRPVPGRTTPELPSKPQGYYHEYVHPTPGVNGPGPQRIVVGDGGEMYYTPDHYDTFVPLNGGD